MIKFLAKGLLRDRSRSLFPTLTVMIGVMLTVFMYSYMNGVTNDFIRSGASFNTGHMKVMSRAYAGESDRSPNDLAYIGSQSLITDLKRDFPEIIWTPRIRFGGLLDIPDEKGETRAQSPVAGLGIDLFSTSGPEREILNLNKAVVRGRLPGRAGEILISNELSRRLGISLGETATLISSTMYGSMAAANFKVVGTVRFGISAMDRGAMLADISDIQRALDMDDAAGEILGFFGDQTYRGKETEEIVAAFNKRHQRDDEFSPVMVSLRDQNGLGETLDMFKYYSGILISVFVVVMSMILWNAGLMGSIRRYGEIGLRLAIGENKGHVYRTMILESLAIGLAGTIVGTALGVSISYFLQVKGINIGSMMRDASILMSVVIRARVTPVSFIIGFIPGLMATLLGASIAGIGIYKRQTSQLARELET
ncbi:MAG: ABC transporter permease [Candidatus Zixiibacteriota bacterium]|nr:MAG: ABC transporter permease [candidate division Zixibacteria bacterium]